MGTRIGIIPLPIHVMLFAGIAYLVMTDKLPREINVMIAVLAVCGFTCAEVGHRTPLFNQIGGAAICATFVPSFLTYYHYLPADLVAAVTEFTKSTNFLYLFIAAIVVGSILSMDRAVLVKGFLRIFVPLAAGSVVALVVGTATGALLGLGARHTLLMIVIPVMAGGVGEGAIPLSAGYAQLWHQDQGGLFAQVLPAVMFGSLTAILLAGTLNYVGRRYPRLTGEGRLQPDGQQRTETHEGPGSAADDALQPALTTTADVRDIAAAGLLAVALYLLGLICFRTMGIPAPVAMLFLAVVFKLSYATTEPLQQGASVIYNFFRSAVTYPLLFAIGVAMTPWDKLLAAFAPANLITIVITVSTLMVTGFFVGRWVGLYPIEAAIVNACHSGQGGTGDVAILTAANRLTLMPFAQISTRIGGAITVTLTLVALAHWG
jgi:CCS family citrate carrier protein